MTETQLAAVNMALEDNGEEDNALSKKEKEKR